MKKLGKVIRIRGKRKLIVKANFVPKVLQVTYDERLRPIGRVYDVFGPVSSPYVSVVVSPDISESEIELLLNKPLYVKTLSKRFRKGRRR